MMPDELNNAAMGGALPSEQVDLLVSRLVDGVAGAGDWERFCALARENPGAWRVLAVAQQQQGALQREFDRRMSSVHRVDLPRIAEDRVAEDRVAAGRSGGVLVRQADGTHRVRTWNRLAGLGMWGGWLAAAAVALAWASGMPLKLEQGAGGGGVSTAGIVPTSWTINTPDDAVNAYLKVGAEQQRVLGEVPGRMLVSSRELGDNQGVEVVFVRRFVERAVVHDLSPARMGRDELGRSVPMPVVVPVSSGRSD